MINSLYDIQEVLNDRILKEHNLDKSTLLNDKFLALLVELSELANETRCFKYWSLKPASDKAVIIEEFSDVIHFLLTIGLELDRPHLSFYDQESDLSLTELFLSVYNDVNLIRHQKSKFVYIRLYNNVPEELHSTSASICFEYSGSSVPNRHRQSGLHDQMPYTLHLHLV